VSAGSSWEGPHRLAHWVWMLRQILASFAALTEAVYRTQFAMSQLRHTKLIATVWLSRQILAMVCKGHACKLP